MGKFHQCLTKFSAHSTIMAGYYSLTILFIGEPGLLISGIPPYYSDLKFYKGGKEVNEKKIVRNVFKRGDIYFNFGDMLEVDKDFFVYFKDRVGDTFR